MYVSLFILDFQDMDQLNVTCAPSMESVLELQCFKFIPDGAPKIAKLPYKWFYGRYNYS